MTFVKRVTGPSVTDSVNMQLADLGIARWDVKRKANAVMFGDNFSTGWANEWQSPSIIMYDNDYNVLGIPAGANQIVSQGNRRQALNYEHHKNGVSTKLPTDFIRIGDTWHMAVMVVGEGGLGDERSTDFHRSQDLVNWEPQPELSLPHPSHPGNTMLTFDQIGDYVYIFGTGGLHRDKPIWLWRNKAAEFPGGFWEPWGMDDNATWGWGNANERTPVLPGNYGELCFRYIQGNCVLSFFDVDHYCCSALTVVNPTDYWPGATRIDYANGQETPQLYGGYISPDSQLNTPGGMKFLVSQWNTATNDPYHVLRFDDTLQAKGPLVAAPAPPTVLEPLPKPPAGVPMTPQQTYALLISELSASGSVPITTSDGRNLTLREAVAELYAESCSLQNLRGHQLDPRMSAPQLDHVLAGRYEGLLSLDLLVAIAKKLGVNVGETFAKTREVIG